MVLVCGSDKSDFAWKEVPLLQAKYQLNVILQNLGYLNSQFVIQNEKLYVRKGPLTETEKLVLTGTNGIVDVEKKRKIIGYPIIPAKLDEVKKWAELAARRQGHACPEVTMKAEVWNKTIFADIEPGQSQTINEIVRSGYGDLDPESIHRFEAFRKGQRYNVIETQITADRMMAQGLFQNAYITPICNGDKVDLNFVTEVGKPKLLRFSVGGSTEEFPFTDVWYKDARLDNRASNYNARLHVSPVKQKIEVNSEFYIIPHSYTTFLGPRFLAEHLKERVYEMNRSEVGADLGRGWDISGVRLDGRIGPTVHYSKTLAGQGPPETTYLAWEGKLDFLSHALEAFSRNQYEGWDARLEYSGQREYLGSGKNIDRYDFNFKYLYNVNGYSPPLFVIASRFEGIMLDPHTRDQDQDILEIPLDLRIYYGGNENLRGFQRHALNNSSQGYLSAALAGFELRLIEVLPYHVEPFLLYDVAKLGKRQNVFMEPTFYSYGAGLRWVSPFGTLRGSAARGQIFNNNEDSNFYPTDWVFFISFGQEF
ncbi:MAG: BamA/TamA family outer membrane protein [Bdellovibrionota bacterium]